MSRMQRIISQSGVYHILFRGVNQQSIFEEDADYIKLKETITKVKDEMKFEIYAYCFMSNHVHMVIKENQEKQISLIMKRILTKYARWYNLKYGRSGALIANRYKSEPVEIDEYFMELVRYIHNNPLKAGLVSKLNEYPFSSYNEYFGEKELISNELIMTITDMEVFKQYHEEKENYTYEVDGGVKRSDEELRKYIRKKFKIENAKEITSYSKEEKIKILSELKDKFSARQIQRVTGVARGMIYRIEK